MARFSLDKSGQIIDSGIKISEQELTTYIQRQIRAQKTNERAGPAGASANKLIQEDLDNAINVHRQIHPDLYNQAEEELKNS